MLLYEMVVYELKVHDPSREFKLNVFKVMLAVIEDRTIL
jgi:hypothetical protein